MACEKKIHKGDINTLIKTTVSDCSIDGEVPMDLTTGSFLFYFKKPDFSTLSVVPVLTTDGTDGTLQYSTVEGDFDLAGEYQFQVVVTTPTGSWSTEAQSFTVYNTIG